MKFLTCFAFVAAIATVVTAAVVGTSQQVVAQNFLQTLSEESSLNAPASELARLKKSAYGGSAAPSIPAPACPKNYLFSCQPNLAPVPCASAPAAPSYSGSYSAPVPTYAFPRNHPGIAPELLRNYYY